MVNAFLGDNISLIYVAAIDSSGSSNKLFQISLLFENVTGYSIFDIRQSCESEVRVCYEYKYSINSIRPHHAGKYTGFPLGK